MRDIIRQNSKSFASDTLILKAIYAVEQCILTLRELETRYEMTTLILAPAWMACKGNLNLLKYALLGFRSAATTGHLSSSKTLEGHMSPEAEQHLAAAKYMSKTSASLSETSYVPTHASSTTPNAKTPSLTLSSDQGKCRCSHPNHLPAQRSQRSNEEEDGYGHGV